MGYPIRENRGKYLDEMTAKKIGLLVTSEKYRFADKELIAEVVRDTFYHAYALGEEDIKQHMSQKPK